MNRSAVPYHRLRSLYPSLFIDVVGGEPRASKLFRHPWRDPAALVARAKRAAEKGMEKGVLDALRAYHIDLDAPKESRASLDLLGKGAAIVITGQQPAVALGPLYNLYKAAGAIQLAKEVGAVPVFWNHSDDTRGGESAAFPDREHKVREVPLPPGEPGKPLYEAGTPEAFRMFVGALGEALPRTEHTDRVNELLRRTQVGSIAEAFSRLLLALFGPEGLVVLEPRHLEGERAAKLFDEHQRHPERLSKAVEAGREAVVREMYEDHLGRDVGLDLFEIKGSRRTRVEAPGAGKGRLSAGVALRPLLQDAVLPTCAYVGGPSEVGYQAALGPAYDAFGIEPPVVAPRPTATLLEPKITRALEGGDLAGALIGEGATAPGPEEDVLRRLEELRERWTAEAADALGPLRGPSLERALEKTTGKVREALGALSGRVKDELERREETGRGRRARLLAHLRPLGKPQERVFTPLYYAALYGPDVLPRLAAALDVRSESHQRIEIL
ncbi:MAG TPA: bacillithiol biosynthesis BshC [Planctomycetota bacterium]